MRDDRSLSWRLRTKTLAAGRIPRLMGVVNVTPDSFSDGGRFFEPAAAVEHGLRLAAEGADVLDVGGQSTRPGAAPIAAKEELRRVLPVVVALSEQTGRADFDRYFQRRSRRRVPCRRGGGHQRHHRTDRG